MDKLKILGGLPLVGEVQAAGAKNAALPILCASLLTADPLELSNVPQLQDIATTIRLLKLLGVKTERDEERLTLQADSLVSTEAPYELVKTMRASILVLGPLLARFGEARVSLPGGCAIGQRPVDQHIKGLQAMGAQIDIEQGFVVARAARLKGARIVTDMVTVTGTENLMMAACLAEGETILENAAREPEVVDLAKVLVAMGAQIEGAGTDRLVIRGVERLHGASHRIMADRIETGTFLCAAAACGGDVTVRATDPWSMDVTIDRLRETGATLTSGPDWVRRRQTAGRVRSACARRRIRALPPTCRRSSWRWTRWPKARPRWWKPFSRTASCTCRSCDGWARTSASRATPPSCRACRHCRGPRSWRPTCGLRPVW